MRKKCLAWKSGLAGAIAREKMTILLGFRYSSFLAISANRLAIRPPAKTRDGRREAAPPCFVDEGVVLLINLC